MSIEAAIEKPIEAAMEGLLIRFELALTKRHSTRYIPISSLWRMPIEVAIEDLCNGDVNYDEVRSRKCGL